MAKDSYRYLNNTQVDFENDLMFSNFAKVIKQGQKRMPAGQWPNFIKSLTNKGVRKTEIEDSGVLEHLATLDLKQPVTREEIVNVIHQSLFTIKELDLAKPTYERYSNVRDPHHSYQETLYILNSPRLNIEDRLNEIQWELENLDFEPELLFENPMLAVDLYEERTNLLKRVKEVPHHRISHFNGVIDPSTNKKIENVLAHARFTVRDDVFFIEEIQSDWGQQGRRNEWRTIPKAPYVTNTDSWAGLVLRRLLQRAAEIPNIKQVAWIIGGMENGGRTGNQEGVNHFYRNVLPKIADKALSGTGEKTKISDVKLRQATNPISLPSIDMTDKVREKFKKSQPLYSHDLLPPSEHRKKLDMLEQLKYEMELMKAREMLGSSVDIRLASKIIDLATGNEVAGQMRAPLRIIEASLNARDPGFVLNHEVYHYAHEQLIEPNHAEAVERAFEPYSYLNDRVREALIRRNAAPEAVAQCDNPVEAAAYGFALWKEGELSLNREQELNNMPKPTLNTDKVLGLVFRTIERSFINLGKWARRVTGWDQKDKDNSVVCALFEQIKTGKYAVEKEDIAFTNHIPINDNLREISSDDRLFNYPDQQDIENNLTRKKIRQNIS